MENELVEISEENIYLEFNFKDQVYVVISKSQDLQEGDEICIAKMDLLDGERIIRNIESDEEYEEVEREFERILDEEMGDEEDDEL